MGGVPNDFDEHARQASSRRKCSSAITSTGVPAQAFNRVVDISAHIEKKIDAIVECRAQGGGNLGSQLRARLAREGKRLPLLGR